MANTAQILQQIKTSVLATDPGATVILYGSYARGEEREDSDIDILVLIDRDKITFDDEKRIGYPIHHIELETGVIISPMIFSRKLWETKHKITPFYKNVSRGGATNMNPEKSEIIVFRITKAKETVEEVVEYLIPNNLWNTSINRLYYACFYAVTALLVKNDIDTKPHSGTKQMFGKHFINTGILAEDISKFYAMLFTMRQKSDYEDMIEYEKEDVLKLIEPAQHLINAIEALLSKN